MERKSFWECFPVSSSGAEVAAIRPVPEAGDTHDQGALLSLDAFLPDDLLEKVFLFLPVASIIRSASVCKRWRGVVRSGTHSWATMPPQKPWYFMFTCGESFRGYAYDPSLRKWYNIELPCIKNRNWSTSSSHGLVCFMDGDQRSHIYVCNPITRDWYRLQDAPGGRDAEYSALAMSGDRRSHCYTIAVVRSKQAPDSDFLQWDLSIHMYVSGTCSWVTPIDEILIGWRGCTESVICNGVLYCLIQSTRILGVTYPPYGLIIYDLSARPSNQPLKYSVIQISYSLTCVRLMNLNDRLIMVGGIGKQDRADIIKGIGIWELHNNEWCEVARMPQRFFQGFGEFDEVFASSGTNDLIYIQSYGSSLLLVFDMSKQLWRWSVKCPVTNKFPLQVFTGFCFEPRLDVTTT